MFDNNLNGLSVNQIIEELDLNDEDAVKRMLHSLFANPKFRLLKKDPVKMPIRRTDIISINTAFKSKVIKFRIPMPTLDKKQNTKQVVDEYRELRIQGAIVRIMKSRKTLLHRELIAETLHQLVNFRPDARNIKLSIGKLIEKEFLERDPDDPQTYRYLA